MITVANSGAEEPAAMKVAPATSGDSLNSEKKIIIKSSHRRAIFELDEFKRIRNIKA